MKKKKKIFKWIILIILGLIIIANILGMVIETLVTLEIVQTDLARIRTLRPVSAIFSVGLIVLEIIFWLQLYKEKKKAFFWWNILVAAGFLAIIYKRYDPTAIIFIIPNYFTTMLVGWFIIWAIIFHYLQHKNYTT